MNVQEFRNNLTYEQLDLIIKALFLLHGNIHQKAIINSFESDNEDKYINHLSDINSLLDELIKVQQEF